MRAYTRAKTLENRAFVKALTRTGNARAAADACGLKIATMYARRRRDPVLATEWDAALTIAQAAAHDADRADEKRADAGGGTRSGAPPAGYHKVRLANGKVQLRRVRPKGLDGAGEQRFLAALSASANVQLAAKAAGYAPGSIYQRARIDPGFAREMKLALAEGYERLEAALLAGFGVDSAKDDAWRHNDPPPIPPMTAEQALQLLTLHQKEVRLGGAPPELRRRNGEPPEAMRMRLVLMSEHRDREDRLAFALAEAARRDGGERSEWEHPAPALPDLAQVLAAATPAQTAREQGEAAAVEVKRVGGRTCVRRKGVAGFGGWRFV